MYPGTKLNYIDKSQISVPEDTPEVRRPLFMLVGSFDMGPETLEPEIIGADFYDLYGSEMSFDRHGQAALQAERIIDNGGALCVKRVVADDATINNIVFFANVDTNEVQKRTELGELVYIDSATGNETVLATTDGNANEPCMVTTAKIKWSTETYTGLKSFDEVKRTANSSGLGIPVIVVTDNGRGGQVTKSIKITPDYDVSRGIGNMFYSARIYIGTDRVDENTVSLDPTTVYGDKSYRIDGRTFVQVNALVDEKNYEALIDEIYSNIAGTAMLLDAEGNDLPEDVVKDIIKKEDLLFGMNVRGNSSNYVSIDEESIDFNATYGVEISGGDNGAFGSNPADSVNNPTGYAAWTKAIADVYNGNVTDEVWDVDQINLFAVLDANYPQEVKDAISYFVTFREDCSFFRDLGLGLDTFIKIKEAVNKQSKYNNFFISNYCTSYQVEDPHTHKIIDVTMMYDMAEALTNHYIANPFSPIAGVANDFILHSAIPGTISFVPIKTPQVDKKQALEDLKVNYAIFEGTDCVVQTLYTTNPDFSQLKFTNNVLAMQEIGRGIREICPACRYILTENDDFAEYNKRIGEYLEPYQSSFRVLELVYTADPVKAAQKIYYAGINFQFLNWAQSEIFDLVANATQTINLTVEE